MLRGEFSRLPQGERSLLISLDAIPTPIERAKVEERVFATGSIGLFVQVDGRRRVSEFDEQIRELHIGFRRALQDSKLQVLLGSLLLRLALLRT